MKFLRERCVGGKFHFGKNVKVYLKKRSHKTDIWKREETMLKTLCMSCIKKVPCPICPTLRTHKKIFPKNHDSRPGQPHTVFPALADHRRFFTHSPDGMATLTCCWLRRWKQEENQLGNQDVDYGSIPPKRVTAAFPPLALVPFASWHSGF